MHQNSILIMTSFSTNLNPNLNLSILDVGSYNVNGTYKPLFENQNWKYTGLDIVEGPNVDITVDKYGEWKNIQDNSFDVIISGQCLEHVESPWLIAKGIERVLKPGGVIFIVVPFLQGIHRYPIDCWRILPDGLEYLFCRHCSLNKLLCGVKKGDSFFCGVKDTNLNVDENKLKTYWKDLAKKDKEVRMF